MFQINVQNMTCGGCVKSVTRAVQSVDPGAAVQVDLASGNISIEGSRETAAAYISALGGAGFPATQAIQSASGKGRAGCCCG